MLLDNEVEDDARSVSGVSEVRVHAPSVCKFPQDLH
jgi:hypothetical protein